MHKTDYKINRWVEYIEELYHGNGPENYLLENKDEVDKGDIILKSAFNRALKDLSNRKAPGIDRIPVKAKKCKG